VSAAETIPPCLACFAGQREVGRDKRADIHGGDPVRIASMAAATALALGYTVGFEAAVEGMCAQHAKVSAELLITAARVIQQAKATVEGPPKKVPS
jgi:uncharacterized protein YjaZ